MDLISELATSLTENGSSQFRIYVRDDLEL